MRTPHEALDIGKAIYELFNEVTIATANLSIAKSLLEASTKRPAAVKPSPSFFNLTIHAHIESAQLYAAKLFDEHDDCASIPWLLKQVKNRPQEFRNRPEAELGEAIREAEETRVALKRVLATLKTRRDRWLTHLDRKTIRDHSQFLKDSALTYTDLEDLFVLATHTLNRMADLHGVPGFLIDGGNYNDSSYVLDLIEKEYRRMSRNWSNASARTPALPGVFEWDSSFRFHG